MIGYRKVGWMWEFNHVRPLYWEEYQKWLKTPLPFGWSIAVEPEEGADYSDYCKMFHETFTTKVERAIIQ